MRKNKHNHMHNRPKHLHNMIIIKKRNKHNNKHTNNDMPTWNTYSAHFCMTFGMCFWTCLQVFFVSWLVRFVYVFFTLFVWCLYDVCLSLYGLRMFVTVLYVCIMFVWFCTIINVIICIITWIIIRTTKSILCIIWS